MVNILTNYVPKDKKLNIIEIGSRPVKLYDLINASYVLSYTFSTPSNHHHHQHHHHHNHQLPYISL